MVAKERCIARPIFKSDATVVVEFLNYKSFRTSIDLIIQDCKHLDFDSPHVTHVQRIDNEFAHKLVGLAQTL